jgi:hypothetical protein
VKPTTRLHLMPRPRLNGAIPPFQYAFMAWCPVKSIRTTLLFYCCSTAISIVHEAYDRPGDSHNVTLSVSVRRCCWERLSLATWLLVPRSSVYNSRYFLVFFETMSLYCKKDEVSVDWGIKLKHSESNLPGDKEKKLILGYCLSSYSFMSFDIIGRNPQIEGTSNSLAGYRGFKIQFRK